MEKRRRRSAEDAKRMILEAAEKRLLTGGPEAVRVQLVARDVGLTDAAVHHHFGSREGLVETLLRHAARGLKARIEKLVEEWREGTPDLARLAEVIADCYEKQGYARLALWLALSGWRDKGQGMFAALGEALHEVRTERARARGHPAPELEETLFLVTLFHMVQVAEPLFGGDMRRSAGLADSRAVRLRFQAWLVRLLEGELGLPAPRGS